MNHEQREPVENPGDNDRCPNCGSDDLRRDEVHNGVAMLYGPWGCACGWSEDERYAFNPDPRIDSRGGFTPDAAPPGVEPPESGAVLKCLLCAREKPWGTWQAGVAVCVDCRDAALDAARAAALADSPCAAAPPEPVREPEGQEG